MAELRAHTDSKEALRIAAGIIAQLGDVPANAPGIRSVRRRVSKELAAAPRSVILNVALELIQRATFGRFIAYELVQHHGETMGSITAEEIQNLGKGVASWAEVDTFACYVSGPAWKNSNIGDSTIANWAKSKDRWWRRAALVSTVALNSSKGERGDARRTLAVCRFLAADRDDMVVKALSWALRVLGKRDPEAVQGFLSEMGDRLAPRVRREVKSKLLTGLKNPRK